MAEESALLYHIFKSQPGLESEEFAAFFMVVRRWPFVTSVDARYSLHLQVIDCTVVSIPTATRLAWIYLPHECRRMVCTSRRYDHSAT